MRFNNCPCVCCNKTFTEADDVVVCPLCGSPHHRECWLKENRCACNERHAEGFVWEFPKQAVKHEENSVKPQTVGNFVFSNGEGVIICPDCKTPNFENDALYSSGEYVRRRPTWVNVFLILIGIATAVMPV